MRWETLNVVTSTNTLKSMTLDEYEGKRKRGETRVQMNCQMRKSFSCLWQPDNRKLLHVLCMAYAMHNVFGTIRKCYSNVDKVIMGVKELFSNSHSRVSTFRRVAPGTKLPPAPVVTRFGKWLEASSYYADDQNRANLKKVLETIRDQKSKKSWAFSI